MSHPSKNPEFGISPELRRIGGAIREAGGRPILVGGWVRDKLLGISHGKDFDVEVFGLPLESLRRVLSRHGHVILVGRHFGVLKLNTSEAEYDISIPRRESNIGKGHKGFEINPDPRMTFAEAAARRDFTINAMGYDFLEGMLLDPTGGQADLEARILRHVGPAFAEDPLRVLRAMQFAGRFRLTIMEETLALCRSLDLSELPRERIWEEVKKLLLLSSHPSEGLGYAKALGVLDYFPELLELHAAAAHPGEENTKPWNLTLAMMDCMADQACGTGGGDTGDGGDERRELVLMCVALCHQMVMMAETMETEREAEFQKSAQKRPQDAPAGKVVTFLGRLTNEKLLVDAVLELIGDLRTPHRFHQCRDSLEPGEVRRLALRISIPLLIRAARAYHQACHRVRHPSPSGGTPFEAGVWLEARARELGVWDGPPEPILKGRHLLERGMEPGPAVGKLVRQAFERQLDGGIASLEEALAWLETQPAATERNLSRKPSPAEGNS